MQIESITHPGLHRQNNEDRFLVRTFDADSALLAVADGMGGHAAGEVASQLAVESLADFDPNAQDTSRQLIDRVSKAHESISRTARMKAALRGMGTTLSVVFISPATAHWAHVGDSRIYLLHDGSLTQVTDDHTIPGTLLKKGEISREQAWDHPYRNVLVRCVGCAPCQPDAGAFALSPGDLVMLSSDGLHDLITDAQIQAVLSTSATLKEKLGQLLQQGLDAGGTDNITAVLAGI